jgi:CPA2 family monovalent cation:H+ antiporter-2
MHEYDLLLTLTGAFAAALVLGYATYCLGLSPIVGYLLAGIAVGPNSPGFTANPQIATQLAELGVVLLMFGVGLHFNLKDLRRVRRIAVPGAIVQCAISAALGMAIALALGWSFRPALVLGLAVAFASTVVVTRLLADAHELQTFVGNVAIGWLIVQDLLAVLALVLLPSIAGEASLSAGEVAAVLGTAAVKILLVVLAVTVVGGRLIPAVLRHIADTRSRELFTLTVLVIALGIALASSRLFGISMALGAFLAGVVVGQSDFSLRAATEALPLRDAFAVLFFVSVGMLFDPVVLIQSRPMLLATSVLVIFVTPLVTCLIILALGYPLHLALRVALSLGQIGEFSFILANVARDQGLLPIEAMQVLVAISIFSIAVSPLSMYCVNPLGNQLRRFHFCRRLSTMRRPLSLVPAATIVDDQAEMEKGFRTVIIGFGPVGQTVARLLSQSGIVPTIVEMNHDSLADIRERGFRAVLGDATHPETLRRAGVEASLSLILSASSIHGAAEIIRIAREANPKIKVIVRSAYLREREALMHSGADTVFAGEGEVAMALAEYILRDLGATADQIDRERDKVRSELFS